MLPTRRLFLATLLILALSSTSCGKPEYTASSHEPSTCPSRSINYITQTLPQQCLTSSWSAQSSSPGSNQTTTFTSPTFIRTSRSVEQKTWTGEASPPISISSVSTTTQISAVASVGITASVVDSRPLTSTLSASHKDETLTERQATLEYDNEIDPLSDDSNFLSFEDWKRRMLEKAGQSSEHIGTPRQASSRSEYQRRTGNINNALDSLGEDAEIELDFSGFASPETTPGAVTRNMAKNSKNNGDGHKADASQEGQLSRKSKDAGTTCKERFNYASFDCAATVLKTNPECKGSTAVLVENKDSYMLNECSAKNKFLIVELCNDILIDTVVLGNFEFFSSTFRTFRISVSDRYPVKLEKWKELGTFEARNTREVQAFLVENPLIWARYLRLEFLTHYGNEYYCPASLLRIHGKTMMDDYRHDVKNARGEEYVDDEAPEIEDDTEKIETSIVSAEVLRHKTTSDTPSPAAVFKTMLEPIPNSLAFRADAGQTFSTSTGVFPWFTYKNPLYEQHQLLSSSCAAEKSSCYLEFTEVFETPKSISSLTTSTKLLTTPDVVSASPETGSKAGTQKPSTISSLPSTGVVPMLSIISNHSEIDNKKHNSTLSTAVSTKASANATSQTSIRSSHQPPSPSPTTQESFFKSIHKRLQLLESNSTLSLQYIEEQSRILREAFTKVEKRQLSKTTTFLDALNTTVLNELRDFRNQYDQIWQSTVLELSAQREQSQREVIALSARLGILADEILFQKRMAIVQFLLIVLCLGLVIFSRAALSSSAYCELQSAVHNMVSKPSAKFSRYLHFESPPGSPSRPTSRYGFFSRTTNHMRSPSNESTLLSDGRKSPSVDYSPPTPISSPSDDDREEDFSPDTNLPLRRTVSSPAVSTTQHDGENDNLVCDTGEDG